jgi:hypothetical protein
VEKWIKLFERKSGTPFTVQKHEQIVYNEDKGFYGYILNAAEKTMVVTKLCGDGKHWVEDIARNLEAFEDFGIDKLFFTTYRNPKAFCRLLGGVIAGHQVKADGRTLYYIVSNLKMTKESLERREAKCPV